VHLLDLLEDTTMKVKSLYFNHVMEEAATAKIAPKCSRLNPLHFRQKNLSEIPALQLLGKRRTYIKK
jgi:hypothetical protein